MDDQGPRTGDGIDEGAPALDPLLAATLDVSGELGYRRTSAEAIAARAGSPAAYLYSHYSGREDCFAAAYEARAEPLADRLLEVGREAADPVGCLDAALRELFGFAVAEPGHARAILVEVYVAGGAAQARHEQILRRLSDAVSGTRRESPSSRHDPPPVTAAFIVGGIEEVVRRRVGERRAELLWDELPVLVAFATARLQGQGPTSG